jgi:3-deoxy-D-manno-octulosonate 8-phosphate phosphatase (KDO 8-P phosphatase)
VAVADACAEARAAAHYVTLAPGGRGAVREVVELILRAQGRWAALVESVRG